MQIVDDGRIQLEIQLLAGQRLIFELGGQRLQPLAFSTTLNRTGHNSVAASGDDAQIMVVLVPPPVT